MSVPAVFQRITTALNQASIAYMLSGSFASAYYGAPRSTQDIDLVIEASAPQLREFVHALPASAYSVDLEAALEAQKPTIDVQRDRPHYRVEDRLNHPQVPAV